MPPHPKRKHSSGRRDRRRAHDALVATHLVSCEHCGEMHLPHTMCPKCGHYRNREIVDMEAAEKKKK